MERSSPVTILWACCCNYMNVSASESSIHYVYKTWIHVSLVAIFTRLGKQFINYQWQLYHSYTFLPLVLLLLVVHACAQGLSDISLTSKIYIHTRKCFKLCIYYNIMYYQCCDNFRKVDPPPLLYIYYIICTTTFLRPLSLPTDENPTYD